jgi:hypothetical protein
VYRRKALAHYKLRQLADAHGAYKHAQEKAKDAETARSITAAVVAAHNARADTRALARALHARFADKIVTERAPKAPMVPAKDGTDAKGAVGGVGSRSR